MNCLKEQSEPEWERQFTEEFGIHFEGSNGELQFALEFISTQISLAREEEKARIIKEIEKAVEFFDPKNKAIPYVKLDKVLSILRPKNIKWNT